MAESDKAKEFREKLAEVKRLSALVGKGKYSGQRKTMAERQLESSRNERTIDAVIAADFPKIDLPRKTAAQLAFRTFCETYLGAVFCKPWSPDHLKVIAKIEQAVLRGGLFAMAMPRGSGKTSLCEAAVVPRWRRHR